MIEDGLIQSFDELASETLLEWKYNPRKRNITLRNLLELNTGLVQDVEKLQGHDRPTLAEDLYAHAISVPLVDTPDEQSSYGPSCYYVLGEIIKRKLKAVQGIETALDYLKQRLFLLLGIDIGKCVHDAAANPHIPNGTWVSARNWAVFGQFMLQRGEWNGEQLVSAALMREVQQPSRANPGYGLAIWLSAPGGASYVGTQINIDSDSNGAGGFIYSGGEPDLFGAMGSGKNRMYMKPARSVVVLRQTVNSQDGFEDHRFLELLLDKTNTVDVEQSVDSAFPQKF